MCASRDVLASVYIVDKNTDDGEPKWPRKTRWYSDTAKLPNAARPAPKGRAGVSSTRADAEHGEASSPSTAFIRRGSSSTTTSSSTTAPVSSGTDSVWQGLVSNSVILGIKFMAFLCTRSQAIYAEMMHSVADVMNYSYRLLMLRQSELTHPTQLHPYGYAPLRYITADRSFVILGIIGGVFP
ncbi:unnamed protein product, partial [Amoebophrya sp. A25]|eukprot:GSA25T00010439001.1